MKWAAPALAAVLALAEPALAYLHFTSTTFAGQSITLKWQRTPVRWFAKDRGTRNVSPSEFQAVLARAFATWEAVPTAAIAFQFAGFTGAEPFDDDGVSVVGFQEDPEMDVLGATGFLIDVFTGEILESDIFFNSALRWSTAPSGDPTAHDLESVALHEVGHFLGLGHSALGETDMRPDGGRRVLGSGSVMFPIAFGLGVTHDRELQPDDIAGASDLYPDGNFRRDTGIARGRVTRNDIGVQGAHVTAFHPETGAIVAGFTVNRNGDFQIAGLAPGPHVIRVEPLDDADTDGFFSRRDPIDVRFQATFHPRLFIAPSGGEGDPLTVAVTPK
jgi:hypothetical protein